MLIHAALLAGSCFAITSNAQACSTSTVASAVPTATALALNEYSYCGGTLSTRVFIENIDYNKIVTLYYSDADNQATPLTVISLGYNSSIPDTNYESWGSITNDVNIDGVTRLLNITYQATDVGQTNVQQLNLPVVASGPAPTTSSAPKPYASPIGFAQDITSWLRVQNGGVQIPLTKKLMFNNIEVTNAVKGSVVAAQSYADPDYGYKWVRDASLTMDVVATLYGAATSATKQFYQDLFFRYAVQRAQEQNDPDLITGLGEPKFNLDGSAFTGPWGRPQNDGPATAAIALMEFSNAYIASGGAVSDISQRIYNSNSFPRRAPLRKDLMFVAANWSSPSFDLWEEEESTHFYTRMVQHKAILMGAAFAKVMSDPGTANTLSAAASDIAATLPTFFNSRRNLILYETGPVLAGKSSFKDSAVMLGVIHGYAGDGVYAFSNDQILATAYQVATSFLPVYPIASRHADGQGRTLGIPIGRYPEDIYNGVTTSRGNPWYLCTAAMAEIFYRASTELSNAGSIAVTNVSLPFWKYFAPQAGVRVGRTYSSNTAPFQQMIAGLHGWGDAFIRTFKFYTPAGGHLSEEIDRESGNAVGAIDLTWSYASLLTASFARAEAIGNTAYIADLANMAVATNTSALAN